MVRFLAAFDNTPSIESILPAHHLPSLVIAGEDDPLVSGDQARALAEQLGGEYRSLKDIGHSIPAEAPDVLMREVDDFFETNCGHG